MGPTANKPFRKFEYHYSGIVWAILWDPNKVFDIGEWSIYEWSVREGLLYMHPHIHTHTHTHTQTHTHTHIYIHIYTYIYTHVQNICMVHLGRWSD